MLFNAVMLFLLFPIASRSSEEADQHLLAPPSELDPNKVDDEELKLNQLSRAERLENNNSVQILTNIFSSLLIFNV